MRKQWNKITEIAREYKAQALYLMNFLKKKLSLLYRKSIAAFHAENGIGNTEFLNPQSLERT